MPPPMPNPTKRMTANPARPVRRYRPGKAVAEEASSEEEEDGEDQEQQKQTPPARLPTRPPHSVRPQVSVSQDNDDGDEDEDGFVTEEEDEDEDGGASLQSSDVDIRPMPTSTKRPPQQSVKQDELGEASEEDEDEDDSSEEDSSDSEPEPSRKFQRPAFIRKSDRKPPSQDTTSTPSFYPSNEPDESQEARRKAMAELMIKDKLEKDAQARLQGKKSWDDDEDVAPEDMVDDTDPTDPTEIEHEHQRWRLRELQRLKRDRDAIIEREKEIEEILRRQNLTPAEREREDTEFLERQKRENDDNRGETGYLKKYYHKGAFFQDEEAAETLAKRDMMGVKFVDEVDKDTLPEYMRIRDMTKLGKKGRTRYRDLRGEDTGRFGDEVKRWRPGDSVRTEDEVAGVDERFLPDGDRRGGGPAVSGANASVVGERRRNDRRGESPPTRKRSPSPYRDRDDKRRRVEVL